MTLISRQPSTPRDPDDPAPRFASNHGVWPLLAAMFILTLVIDVVGLTSETSALLQGQRIGSESLVVQRIWTSLLILALLIILGVVALALHRRYRRDYARWSEDLAEIRAAGRLRAAVGAVPALIWQTDNTGACCDCSASWLAFTGRTLEQEQGLGWSEGVHPDDRAACLESFHRAFESRTPFRVEYRLLRADGEYRWLVAEGRPFNDADSRFLGFITSCVDITSLREFEATHRELHAALTTALEGVATLDAAGRYLSVNTAYADALGMSPESMIGRSWEFTLAPDDVDRVRAAWHAMREAGHVEIEARGRRADGSLFPKRISMIVRRDGLNNFAGHYCLVKDLSERADSVRSRLVSARFDTLADNSPVGIFYTDPRGEAIHVNAAIARFTGMDLARLLGAGWIDAVHHADRDRVRAEWAEFVALRSHLRTEFRFETPGSRTTWVYALASPVVDTDGSLIGFIGTHTDITALKDTQTRLSAVSSFNAGLLANLGCAVFAFDHSGVVTVFNRAAEAMLGYSADEVIGVATPALWHDAADFLIAFRAQFGPDAGFSTPASPLQRIATPQHTIGRECVFLRRDGSTLVVQLTLTLLLNDAGAVAGFLGSAVDMTDIRRAHDGIAAALSVAEHQRQRESLLRRELDHRVRNNLAALTGLTGLYSRSGRSGDDVASALRGKFLALNEVHDLIARSRNRSITLNEVLARLLTALVVPGRRPHINIRGPRTDLPASQAGAFAMILHELITNSLKHGGLAAPDGSIVIDWYRAPSLHGELLVLDWTESGSTADTPQHGSGVGLGLIRGLARSELQGEAEITLSPSGLSCRINALLHDSDPAATTQPPTRVPVTSPSLAPAQAPTAADRSCLPEAVS